MGRELPIIDADTCTGCGICIAVCPDRIIEAGPSGRARLVGERCLQCGHCFAVCPVEAVRVPFLDDPVRLSSAPGAGPPGDGAALTAKHALALMQQRRSCRLYQERPLDRRLLEDLVGAGGTAPSGTNSQGWRFLVLPGRDQVIRLGEATAAFYRRLNRRAATPLLRGLLRAAGRPALDDYYRNYHGAVTRALEGWERRGEDRLFHGAPAAIVVAADRRSSCPAEDALLASQNILLLAQALGLGTCLIGYVVEAARRDPAIGRLLGLGPDHRIHSVIAVGHPAVEFLRPVGRRPLRVDFVTFSRAGDGRDAR